MKFFQVPWCMALISASVCFAQSNPVPFINQPLVPAAVEPAGPGFKLTVNGAGFVNGSIVDWNGTPLATKFVSAIELTAQVPAGYTFNPGTARITVVNPTPGGGSSDPALFTVAVPASHLRFQSAPVEGLTLPINAITADFNHDGIPDLAAIDQAPAPSCNYQFHGVGSIAIFLGNGDGTFTRHSTVCVPDLLQDTPQKLALAGDVNRDGNIDLVVVCSSQEFGDMADVFYGNGDGTFIVPQGGFNLEIIDGLVLGDFDHNGQLDLALSGFDDFGLSTVAIDGINFLLVDAFGAASPLAVGDFNRDGLLSLAAAGGPILLNSGNGQFTQQKDIPAEDTVVAGDFNGDGIPDLAGVNGTSITVLLGKGDGTFTAQTGEPVTANPNVSLITADINGDGKLDLIVTDSTNTVSVYLGKGDGTFRQHADMVGQGDTVAVADFNNDWRMDLAITNSADNTVSILLQGQGYKALVEHPIDADGTSIFPARREDLPVKFSLTEDNTPTCSLPRATIAITRTAGGRLGSIPDYVYATRGDEGSRFRIDRSTCQYIYKLAAHSLAQEHTAPISPSTESPSETQSLRSNNPALFRKPQSPRTGVPHPWRAVCDMGGRPRTLSKPRVSHGSQERSESPVTGHDFSRAESSKRKYGALAPA
jgi:hypothetical protein